MNLRPLAPPCGRIARLLPLSALLLVSCADNSHLSAITCNEKVTGHLFSNIKGAERDQTTETEGVNNYLLNTKTGQVKRWIDKKDAPLVARTRVRFAPDVITWAYDDDTDEVTENRVVLDRATLAISGTKRTQSISPGVGGYFQILSLSGQCKKTSIPWKQIKTNQV